MFAPLLSVFKASRWEDNFVPALRVVVADTEYQIGWNARFTSIKDEEKKEEFHAALGEVIKLCLKDASRSFNIMNPVLKDIDNRTVYLKSIASHRITPVFVSSTTEGGVKTVIGVVFLLTAVCEPTGKTPHLHRLVRENLHEALPTRPEEV